MLQSDGTIFEFKMWPRDVVCLTDPLDPKKQECGDPSNTRLRAIANGHRSVTQVAQLIAR